MPAVRTLDARALRPIHEAIGESGAVALRSVGLSPATLQLELRLPSTKTDALWQAAVDHSDAKLPLRIAQTVGAASYGHLTYLLAAAPTIGDAFRASVVLVAEVDDVPRAHAIRFANRFRALRDSLA